MSHDTVVSRAFQGSFRRRERRTGKEMDAVGKKVGGLEKRKDVVRTVLQAGPLRLRADKDQGRNRRNFVLSF